MTRLSLHYQILLAMMLGGTLGIALNLGVANGSVEPATLAVIAAVGKWLGEVFLTLLNMIVVPLIFSSLVSSITQVGQGGGNLRRLGFQTIAYYMLTSALAIVTGLVMVNLIRPGVGVDYNSLMAAAHAGGHVASPPDIADGSVTAVLVNIVFRLIPTNVVAVASTNSSILGLIFFAVTFGVAAVHTGGAHLERINGLFTSIYDVMITLTNGILMVAPLGIGGYLLFVTASTGLDLAGGLAWYMLTVFLALCVHALITLPALLWFVTQRSPVAWAINMKEALLTAFSTASSSGTLPLTMRCVRRGGVSERVTSFTLPLGATLNMDGTALYEAVAVLFVAQMLGDLDLGQQVVVAVTALLASVGAAGIPHAGTVMMVIVMQAVGLPSESVLVILAVDRVLDMCRTAVNVWSDAIGAAIINSVEDLS